MSKIQPEIDELVEKHKRLEQPCKDNAREQEAHADESADHQQEAELSGQEAVIIPSHS